MRAITLQGESLSADTSGVDQFEEELATLMETEGYTLSQVFNADETGLLWRHMPSRTLVHNGEKHAKNFKTSKERVTLFVNLCQCYWIMQASTDVYQQK